MLAQARLQTIICTTRLEESRIFYTDKLGLDLKQTSEGALVFDVGGSDLRVSPVPAMTPNEHTVIGFAVADLDTEVRTLAGRGIEFERFKGFAHNADGILTTATGSRVAWIRDPDGNLLSVVQLVATE